jgi:hypothetical protein
MIEIIGKRVSEPAGDSIVDAQSDPKLHNKVYVLFSLAHRGAARQCGESVKQTS